MTETIKSDASTLVVGPDAPNGGYGAGMFPYMFPWMMHGAMHGQHDAHNDLHISNQLNQIATREVLKAVADGECRTSDRIHITSRQTELTVEKTAAATNLAVQTGELRLSKELCEVKQLIQQEGCSTRELIKDVESRRVRDDLAQLRAEFIALKSACCNPCAPQVAA